MTSSYIAFHYFHTFKNKENQIMDKMNEARKTAHMLIFFYVCFPSLRFPDPRIVPLCPFYQFEFLLYFILISSLRYHCRSCIIFTFPLPSTKFQQL